MQEIDYNYYIHNITMHKNVNFIFRCLYLLWQQIVSKNLPPIMHRITDCEMAQHFHVQQPQHLQGPVDAGLESPLEPAFLPESANKDDDRLIS